MTMQEIEELERDPERAWRETGSRLRVKLTVIHPDKKPQD